MKCSDCKGELVGGYDLQRIICWSCHDKRGLSPIPPLLSPTTEAPPPPPTTEWRGRQPYKRPSIEGVVMAIMAASFSLGFIVGFLVRGAP